MLGTISAATRLCSRCHARIAVSVARCPACGGALVADPGAGAAPVLTDHRGIVLPERHAVGGIITPR